MNNTKPNDWIDWLRQANLPKLKCTKFLSAMMSPFSLKVCCNGDGSCDFTSYNSIQK